MTDPIRSIKVHAVITGVLLVTGGGATWMYVRNSTQHEREFLKFYARNRLTSGSGGVAEDRVRAVVHEELKPFEVLILENRNRSFGAVAHSQPEPVPHAKPK